MIALARDEVPVMPDELDQHPMLFNCLNGTIELETGTLREHRRGDMLTKLCPTEFNPDASTHEWDRFLEDIFGGDQMLIDFMHRLCGYCISGDVREQVLGILWGSGANGKSTFLNAIMETLGPDYAIKGSPDLLMMRRSDDHPTKLADLFGKRLVACVETGEGRRLNEPLAKELSGGDAIRARKMREDFWEFRPTHKILLCSNHRPVIRGTDNAVWRRLRLVPFTKTFDDSKQDKALPNKLRAEAEGILAWAVRGCVQWQADGLGLPEIVKEATAGYRQSQDIVAEFIAEICIVRDGATVRSKELFAAYADWCKTAGERPMNRTRFGTSLAAAGFVKRKSGDIWWDGLELTAED
jgi:putative DNA primase/helicase